MEPWTRHDTVRYWAPRRPGYPVAGHRHRSRHRSAPRRADYDRRCFLAAASAGPAAEIFLDVPGPRSAARGLTPRSHTVRMSNGPVPPETQERTFALTGLELG
ncbi:hypothetical protein [Streptomyces kronopolitis]|uniref:hypothetical protein n=1 Tax=Streptomyces kronopolitis TaxID=1612435 RepID=UPI003439EBCA